MRKILVKPNEFALINNCDYRLVSQHQWWLSFIKSNGAKYAKTDAVIKGKKTTIFMHRLILKPKGKVDHINGNGLDNRRMNLRECTNSQNSMNSRKLKNTSSRFKGVSFTPQLIKKQWRVIICINGKNINLGYFETEIEAAKAYNRSAKELFGKYAWLNKI